MRFLVDVQLPPLLAHHLASLGHHAEHTVDIGLASSDDRDIWQYAVANSAIIITKDEDFVTIRALAEAGPPVLWIRIGNTTKNELLKRFTLAWPRVAAALERGETVIEIA
jgi:predicted nuclease of predicted toxin-antitoxin system